MNSYISRLLEEPLEQLASWFPVVSLRGPRQSGKSTLVRHVFSRYEYVNLEDPQTRMIAREDPMSFIANHSSKLIIDEAQYAPDIFSAIQLAVDKGDNTSQYVLTGSQNFLMLKSIGQSLAGRVGLLSLLPFSYKELYRTFQDSNAVDSFMLQGGYSRIYAAHIPPSVYFASYIQTYIERDVAEVLDVRNKAAFQKLLLGCAQTAGKLLNITSLAQLAGVSTPTARQWLSVLESSYLTFLLQPYHTNPRKRLVKTPKLYFYDTGLLCHLLKITTWEELVRSPYLGTVFENLIVCETAKYHFNVGENPELYFYRDDSKREIDLLDFTHPASPQAIEIKSSHMYHDKYAKQLSAVGTELGIEPSNQYVVCRVESSYHARSANVVSARDWLLR